MKLISKKCSLSFLGENEPLQLNPLFSMFSSVMFINVPWFSQRKGFFL